MARGPLDRLKQGTAPRGLRIAVAEGILPLDGAELIEAFSILSIDPDEEVRTALAENMPMLPRQLLLQIVHDPAAEPHFLNFIAHHFNEDDEILSGIILNKNTSDETMVYVAGLSVPSVLSLLSENKKRIIKCPEILDTLLENEQLPRVNRYALIEFKESWAEQIKYSAGIGIEAEGAEAEEIELESPEFSGESIRAEMEKELENLYSDQQVSDIPVEEVPEPETPVAEPAIPEEDVSDSDSLKQESKADLTMKDMVSGWDMKELVGTSESDSDAFSDFDTAEFDLEDEPSEKVSYSSDSDDGWEDISFEDDDDDLDFDMDMEEAAEEEKALDTRMRLLKMSAAEKLLLAKMGTKQERAVLVRDANKKVALAVIHSPKMSEFEITMIAQNRSVNEDVLREIYLHREWGQIPNVRKELVLNPKTPLSVSLRLLSSLNDFQLKDVSRSKEIPYALQANAKRILVQRESRRTKKS